MTDPRQVKSGYSISFTYTVYGKVYRKAKSSEFLFDFDPLDSHMEGEISTTSSTDSKEIFILTHRIGHEITNHYERSRRF